MPTMAEVRQQFPQYDDMSDDELASALHRKFYSDMPEAEFRQKIGLDSPNMDFGTPPPGVIIHGADKSYVSDKPDVSVKRTAPDGSREQNVQLEALRQRGQTDGFGPALRGTMPAFQGYSGNFGDEAVSAAAATIKPGSFRDTYDVAQEFQRQELQREQSEHPIRSVATSIGGMLANPLVRRAPAAGVVPGMRTGATMGALYGAGDGTDGESRVSGALAGGAVGGVLGGAIGRFVGRSGGGTPPGGGGGVANSVVASGDSVGVDVPRYLASDGQIVPRLAASLKESPMGGAIMRSSEKFLGDVRGALNRTAEEASGGALKERGEVGALFRSALNDAIDRADETASGAYKSLRGVIDPNATANVTAEMSPTLSAIMKARQAAGEGSSLGKELDNIVELVTRPEGVTFAGLQRARSQLNRAINWDARNGGFATGDLKQAKGALNAALESAARQTAKGDPERAVQLLQAADKRFATTAANNKALANLLKTGADEQLVEKVAKMASERGAGNVRQLQFLRNELGQDAFDDMAGMIIQRMGVNKKGELSGELFRNAWNTMSPEGKRILFRNPATREALDAIDVLAGRIEKANKLRSPSGNTLWIAGGAGALGGITAYADPATAAKMAGVALMTVAAARGLSRPASTKAAARFAKAYSAMIEKPSAASAEALQRASGQFGAIISREFQLPQVANDASSRLIGSLTQSAASPRPSKEEE